MQYVARDGDESVVLHWRAGPADRAQAPRLRLRGLDPQAVYRGTTAAPCRPGRYAAAPRTASPFSCRPATARAGC
ncbi:GH36 C-terminal domain-containing protein [Streptomyces sp. NPDC045714]|uniref:GH36 C-terminal domain-containing protein n=1 Tax=Streptomyces sp. NPDC045714 TaxID=3154913 RepID=UPI0033D46CE5